jgi:stage II sporulation protein D
MTGPHRFRRSPARAFVAVVAVAMAAAASCRTVPRPRTEGPTRPPAGTVSAAQVPAVAATTADGPLVRVGVLVDVARATLFADSGVIVRGEVPGHGAREVRVQRATFVGAATAVGQRRFRVQVASLSDSRVAEETAAQVREAAGQAPTVQWNPEARTFQVRVGAFGTRDEALALAGVLQQRGFPGGWVIEESYPGADGRVRLVETGDEFAGATILPAVESEFLSADDLPYRGTLQVRAGEPGVVVINVLPLEQYLRGVVPNELSPTAFPALEALKAQAVAARTYALRNRGQYESKGYDICATPTCQVYRGKSTEQPLSDQAVAETRGLAAHYRGSLINALYTSTCGGHTETGSNIFEGEPTPYLVGVSCAPERAAWTSISTTAVPRAVGDEPGLTRDVALLVAFGVLEPRLYATGALRGTPTDDELRTWVSSLLGALHRQPCPVPSEGSLSRRGTFFRHVVAAACWDERARRLLAPGDADYLLKVEDRGELRDEGERLAAALLVQEGVLAPFADNTLRPNGTLTRLQAVETLTRLAQKAGLPGLLSGVFQGAAGGMLTVKEQEEDRSYPMEADARLFRAPNGNRLAASTLDLVVGDRVRYVLRNGRVVFLEADQSLLGPSADHTSKVYRWEVRETPGELGQALSRFGSVGTVKDVTPLRYGVSGRVIEMNVVGTEGDLLLRGLRVRWGLGLRENLFVVDRERDAAGNVQRFVFTGKGWGHGVGLCQVGSFGMAQAGATYDRILTHYYTGIRLQATY